MPTGLSAALRGSRGTATVHGRSVPVDGDVVSIDGREVRSHEELQRQLFTETRPGDDISIGIVRDENPRPHG